MGSAMAISVKFWGVRGSIACPSAEYIGYGGNTSCVAVSAGGHLIILDAGTGIRGLGKEVAGKGIDHATLLLSHTHLDHINGFPFFAPAFDPAFRLRVMAGHMASADGGIRAVLAHQMENPTFPVPLTAMRGVVGYEDFHAGESFQLEDGVSVKSGKLNHPNGATGYRIEHEGVAVCYVTDTEHVPGTLDDNILAVIADADLVIYDSTYTDAEFPAKVGWGHSTWTQGMRLCQAARVKRLAIFHHEPDHDDSFMAEIERQAERAWPSHTLVARDGMELVFG